MTRQARIGNGQWPPSATTEPAGFHADRSASRRRGTRALNDGPYRYDAFMRSQRSSSARLFQAGDGHATPV